MTLRRERPFLETLDRDFRGAARPHAAELRLRDVRADVEAVRERHRHGRLARPEEEPGLGHPVEDDAVRGRADLGLACDGLGLLEDACAPATRRARACSVCYWRNALPGQAESLFAHLQVGLRAFEIRTRNVHVSRSSHFLRKQYLLALELRLRELDGGAAVRDLLLGCLDLGGPAARLHVVEARLAAIPAPRGPAPTASAVSPRSRRATRSPAFTRSPSLHRHLDDAPRDLRREVDHRRLEPAAQDDDVRVAASSAGGGEEQAPRGRRGGTSLRIALQSRSRRRTGLRSGGGDGLWVLLAQTPHEAARELLGVVEERVRDRRREEREEERERLAARDDGPDRAVRAGARPRRDEEREHAGDERHRRHEDRAEPLAAREDDGRVARHPALAELVRELDLEDRVLLDDAEEHEDPERGEDVERCPKMRIETRANGTVSGSARRIVMGWSQLSNCAARMRYMKMNGEREREQEVLRGAALLLRAPDEAERVGRVEVHRLRLLRRGGRGRSARSSPGSCSRGS